MKKILSLILALALMLSCLAAAAAAEGTDYSGDWYLNEIKIGEVTDHPSCVGLSVAMKLNADGTGVISTSQNGETVDSHLTWTAAETGVETDEEGYKTTYTFENGNLWVDIGEFIMIFGRELAEPVKEPAAVAAESLDAFQGAWQLDSLKLDNLMFKKDFANALGQSYEGSLKVDGDQAALTMSYFNGESSVQIPEHSGTLTFADGAATMTLKDFFSVDGVSSDCIVTLKLTVDGLVGVEMVDAAAPGEALVLYMARAAQ